MRQKWTGRILCILIIIAVLVPQLALGAYSTLKTGARSEEVRRMQQALGGLGYALSADGIFGRATQAAVCAFQRDQGLTVDGKAGNQTLSRLYEMTGGTPAGGEAAASASPTVTPTPTPDGETAAPSPGGATPTPAPSPALTPSPGGESATVTGGRLKMRKDPTGSASVVTLIPDKARVVVTGFATEWSAVTYGRYKGYVMTRYLSFDPAFAPALTPAPTPTPDPALGPTPTPYWAFAPGNGYAYVTGGSLKMRKTPGAAAYMTILPDKTRVVYVEKGGEWTKIIHETITGYVMTKYLVFDDDASPTITPPPLSAGE